jgi:hypothetical protein
MLAGDSQRKARRDMRKGRREADVSATRLSRRTALCVCGGQNAGDSKNAERRFHGKLASRAKAGMAGYIPWRLTLVHMDSERAAVHSFDSTRHKSRDTYQY